MKRLHAAVIAAAVTAAGCGAEVPTVLRRAPDPPVGPSGCFVVDPVRFDRLRIEGEDAAAWLARRTPEERASLRGAETLLADAFVARLDEEPAARGAGDACPVHVRAQVTSLDAGSFYLGRATRIAMEVEVGPVGREGDALRLRTTAAPTPIAVSPLTRMRDAGGALGEQLAADLRRR